MKVFLAILCFTVWNSAYAGSCFSDADCHAVAAKNVVADTSGAPSPSEEITGDKKTITQNDNQPKRRSGSECSASFDKKNKDGEYATGDYCGQDKSITQAVNMGVDASKKTSEAITTMSVQMSGQSHLQSLEGKGSAATQKDILNEEAQAVDDSAKALNAESWTTSTLGVMQLTAGAMHMASIHKVKNGATTASSADFQSYCARGLGTIADEDQVTEQCLSPTKNSDGSYYTKSAGTDSKIGKAIADYNATHTNLVKAKNNLLRAGDLGDIYDASKTPADAKTAIKNLGDLSPSQGDPNARICKTSVECKSYARHHADDIQNLTAELQNKEKEITKQTSDYQAAIDNITKNRNDEVKAQQTLAAQQAMLGAQTLATAAEQELAAKNAHDAADRLKQETTAWTNQGGGGYNLTPGVQNNTNNTGNGQLAGGPATSDAITAGTPPPNSVGSNLGGAAGFNPNLTDPNAAAGPAAAAFVPGQGPGGGGGGSGGGMGAAGGTTASKEDNAAMTAGNGPTAKSQAGGSYATTDGGGGYNKGSRYGSGGSGSVGSDPNFSDMLKAFLPGGKGKDGAGDANAGGYNSADRMPATGGDTAAVLGKNQNIFNEIHSRYIKKTNEGAISI